MGSQDDQQYSQRELSKMPTNGINSAQGCLVMCSSDASSLTAPQSIHIIHMMLWQSDGVSQLQWVISATLEFQGIQGSLTRCVRLCGWPFSGLTCAWHHDTSRVLFVVFELMLHGYSVVFRGGITEEIKGHLSVALEQEITSFWHCEQGCNNFSLFQQAQRSRFMTVPVKTHG